MAEEIIGEHGSDIESITLLRGGSGRFEVTVDGQLVYSKAAEKRHPAPGEVLQRMAQMSNV